MTTEYIQTLTDIDLILENMSVIEANKIPNKLRNFIKENKSNEYISNIDTKVPLEEQQLSKKTIAFLAMLYLNYWCKSEEEKIEYKKMLSENEEKYQNDLKEKYNPNNIFKERQQNTDFVKTEEKLPMVTENESLIKKILKKIFNLFRRKQK